MILSVLMGICPLRVSFECHVGAPLEIPHEADTTPLPPPALWRRFPAYIDIYAKTRFRSLRSLGLPHYILSMQSINRALCYCRVSTSDGIRTKRNSTRKYQFMVSWFGGGPVMEIIPSTERLRLCE